MRIDFHTHVKLAKKLPFVSEYTDWLFGEAKQNGLDAICITEHFNTLGFEEVYNYIRENYPQEGDAFIINGLRIFPGMEIDIQEGGHILALGKIEDIIAFNRALEPYKSKKNFLPFEELLEQAKGFNVYLGGAHPYREGGAIPTLPEHLLKQLYFLDLNGKDYAGKGEQARRELSELATRLNLPMVGGSDTHQAFQYGCIYTAFEEMPITVEELIRLVQLQNHSIYIHQEASFKVESAATLKKALKEIHALGGDYVKVLVGE